MTASLFYEMLNDLQFPDIAVPLGNKAIHARVIQPPGDPRIAASKTKAVLLVAFQLDEPGIPADPKAARPGWRLTFATLDAKGAPVPHEIKLLARPMTGDFVERIPPPDTPPDLTGMLYVGTFWVDVGELYRSKTWRPGMTAELSFGTIRTRLTLN